MTTLDTKLNDTDEERPETAVHDSPLRKHRLSLTIIVFLMALCAIATSWNIVGYPVRFKDEGVYIAQAWAIPNLKALANYTYWYDHPPAGWIQMSIWMELTNGFERWKDNTTMAGREFSVVMRVATVVLIYALARRIGVRRFWSAFAGLLFIFSPLAMYYGRLALLDNIALPWLLASIVLALTPIHRLWAVAGSAACLSVAILTKETTVLLAPALFLALWQNFRHSVNRKYAYLFMAMLGLLLPMLYVVYAAIKSELFPGPDHVSLIEALQWQLSNRKGSGSVFDESSDANNLMTGWLALDKWLPIAGAVGLLLTLPFKRFWPISLALSIQLLMLLRTGYLPSMYVIALLPFMAILAAGIGDVLWPRVTELYDDRYNKGSTHRRTLSATTKVASVIGAIVVVILATGLYSSANLDWRYTLQNQFTDDADLSQRQAVEWLGQNVPKDAVLVSEGEFWLDLLNKGFDRDSNIWVYKVDTDSDVTEDLSRLGGIDYLALSETTLISESKDTLPVVFDAVERSEQVATFGTGGDRMIIMKVRTGE